MKIGYVDDCHADYSQELWKCETLAQLNKFGEKWRELAYDAYQIIIGMRSEDFEVFREGLKKEHRGRYSGDEWMGKYGAIAMPDLMFRISIISVNFKAPFGTAFIRCQEEGCIIRNDDHYEWKEKQP